MTGAARDPLAAAHADVVARYLFDRRQPGRDIPVDTRLYGHLRRAGLTRGEINGALRLLHREGRAHLRQSHGELVVTFTGRRHERRETS
jgi:hypothetical protein